MKEIIFNKKDYKTYKDFYINITQKLDAKNDLNCLEPKDLGFNANHLYNFLRDFFDETHKYIFINFDLVKIKKYKNYEDYQWSLIFKAFEDFAKQYPNNKLEFINKQD